jgi:hypothetical protein
MAQFSEKLTEHCGSMSGVMTPKAGRLVDRKVKRQCPSV